jgi:SH3-like domain-containing protein
MMFALPAAAFAAEGRYSGEPLPRFASIRHVPAAVRVGPDLKYPVKYSYSNSARGAPVKVDNEYYGWCRIVDMDGDKGWVLRASLGPHSSVVTIGASVMLAGPGGGAAVVARLAPGVIMALEGCSGGFCRVKAAFGGSVYSGYVKAADLFGSSEK